MGLRSLMGSGLSDARSVPGGALLEYDVCIVGTGAAGVSVSRVLSYTKLRVCVLEGGGLRPDALSNSARELECSALPIAEDSRERYFGGTTNTWWGKLAPLDEVDFQNRPWVPFSGWPFERSELVPYYRRACALFGIPDIISFQPTSDRRHWLFDNDLITKAFFWNRRPLNFATPHQRLARTSSNVATWLHANVEEVLLDESGSQVYGVSVVTSDGKRFRVSAPIVVVACGGIENARLLLESRSRHPSGLGNDHDQLGRYYMDHPKGDAGFVAFPPRGGVLPTPGYWSGKRRSSTRVVYGVGLSAFAQARHGVLNSYVLLQPEYSREVLSAVRRLYRKKIKAALDPKVVLALLHSGPDLIRYVLFKRFGVGRVNEIRIANFMEQQPSPTNRVTLSDRRDSFGRRLARVHWTISDLEMKTIKVLQERLGSELERRSNGSLSSPIFDQKAPWEIVKDSSHHIGTTRMGTDPRCSVVDATCQVHGVTGLFVAGSSVFATSGSANPTLTIVALALRLGDHIARIS